MGCLRSTSLYALLASPVWSDAMLRRHMLHPVLELPKRTLGVQFAYFN